MDIYLGKKLDSPGTGKGFFLQRLAKAMSVYDDINIVKDPKKKHDISIHLSKIKEQTNSNKNIIRFDGCIIDIAKNFKKNNNNFKKYFKASDGIIYQTQFCKDACDRFVSSPDSKYAIIFNGANIALFDKIRPVKQEKEYSFITASRWRPQKRLRDIVESFLLADIDNSVLYVAGDLKQSGVSKKWKEKYLFNSKKVKYLGILNQEQLMSYLKICRAFIHLSWIDWCPNAVVEAISMGLPVICNNVGGTKELVEPSGGIICEIDKPYNFKPCDLYNPPNFNKQIVADAIIKICKNNMNVYKDHINISNIASQYRKFFKNVMRN